MRGKKVEDEWSNQVKREGKKRAVNSLKKNGGSYYIITQVKITKARNK